MQDIFILPLIPWIQQEGSILLFKFFCWHAIQLVFLSPIVPLRGKRVVYCCHINLLSMSMASPFWDFRGELWGQITCSTSTIRNTAYLATISHTNLHNIISYIENILQHSCGENRLCWFFVVWLVISIFDLSSSYLPRNGIIHAELFVYTWDRALWTIL